MYHTKFSLLASRIARLSFRSRSRENWTRLYLRNSQLGSRSSVNLRVPVALVIALMKRTGPEEETIIAFLLPLLPLLLWFSARRISGIKEKRSVGIREIKLVSIWSRDTYIYTPYFGYSCNRCILKGSDEGNLGRKLIAGECPKLAFTMLQCRVSKWRQHA